MSETEEDDKYRAPALSKGLDILEMLAESPSGRSQAEIAKILGRTTSEIFRMLAVLRKRGYVQINEEGDRYFLTTKMFEIAHRHPPIRRLTAVAGEAMQRLADQINQSVHLGILHSGHVLVVAQVDCQDNNITSVRLGANITIYDTASGRVLAAWMPKPKLDALIEVAGQAESDRAKAFLADLPKVRAAGYCESASLTIRGVTNISAPLFDMNGKVVAAVTIPFIQRLSGTSVMSVEQSHDALLEVCKELSRQLGAGVSG